MPQYDKVHFCFANFAFVSIYHYTSSSYSPCPICVGLNGSYLHSLEGSITCQAHIKSSLSHSHPLSFVSWSSSRFPPTHFQIIYALNYISLVSSHHTTQPSQSALHHPVTHTFHFLSTLLPPNIYRSIITPVPSINCCSNFFSTYTHFLCHTISDMSLQLFQAALMVALTSSSRPPSSHTTDSKCAPNLSTTSIECASIFGTHNHTCFSQHAFLHFPM